MKVKIKTLVHFAGLAFRLLRGGGYYHQPQPKGRFFARDQLAGYYNDLRGKAFWQGARDSEGIPFSRTSQGKHLYFPTTITQYGLGHFDLWLEGGGEEHRKAVFKVADWLVASQDECGGWDVFGSLDIQVTNPYSAMTQGQAISVLLRAFLQTEMEAYLKSAKRALALTLTPLHQGGTTLYKGSDIYLEEAVTREQNTILNGWIFAIFGLWDYALSVGEESAKEALAATLDTLSGCLVRYDRGWWSNYDRHGAIASPFYHRLHIALLEALYELTGRDVFGIVGKRWEGYGCSAFKKTRAVAMKVRQKLHTDQEVVCG